jgi:NAD(P)H-dependent FMN reductase
LILSGSARPDGDTARVVASLQAGLTVPARILDLAPLDLRPFSYGAGQADGFPSIVDAMLESRAILFATPVYWYAMSGRTKTLFDRFTDLLSDRDERGRGRALAGRQVWMLAVGVDPHLPVGFEEPFRLTADYLGMQWGGGLYVRSAEIMGSDAVRLADFAAAISQALP